MQKNNDVTRFKINVTREIYEASKMCGEFNIRTGGKEAGIGSNCAIALAIRDLFPDVWVTEDEIMFVKDWSEEAMLKDDWNYGSVELPKKARGLICEFDNTMPEQRPNLPEFSFEIEVPDELLEKVVNIDDVKTILKDCKTLQLV